jgi:hypothetical protein
MTTLRMRNLSLLMDYCNRVSHDLSVKSVGMYLRKGWHLLPATFWNIRGFSDQGVTLKPSLAPCSFAQFYSRVAVSVPSHGWITIRIC